MANPKTIPFEIYQEITAKKAQYGRFLDTKQWRAFQQIALPGARFRFQNPDGTIISRDGNDLDFNSLAAFVDYFSKLFSKAQTLHMFGPPEMTLESEDRVQVTWAMEDQLLFEGNSKLAELRGGGYYHEEWVRKGDSWWLADLTLSRTYTKLCISDAL